MTKMADIYKTEKINVPEGVFYHKGLYINKS